MEQKVNNTDLELKDRLVAINRVTKVTKGGRAFSFAAIVVVGDEKGVVGWGLGKANEVTTAISKGIEAAKKNLIKVPVLNGTIPQEQIQNLINYLSSQSSSNIKIKNPQNNRFYSTQEGIQDVINSLFDLYEHTSKRCNKLMEESFKRS